MRKLAVLLAIVAMFLSGCATDDAQGMDSPFGITEEDIGTLAAKIVPGILSYDGIAKTDKAIVAEVKTFENGTRFFVDARIFTEKLRSELNKYSEGKIRFLSDLNSGAKSTPQFILAGRVTGLSQSSHGSTLDYILISVQIVDARTSEIVWEDNHEIHRTRRLPKVYR